MMEAGYALENIQSVSAYQMDQSVVVICKNVDQKYLLDNSSIPHAMIKDTELTPADVLHQLLTSIGTRFDLVGVVNITKICNETSTVFFVRQLRGGVVTKPHHRWYTYSACPINIHNRIWADYIENRLPLYSLGVECTPEYIPTRETVDTVRATLDRLSEEIYAYSVNVNKTDVLSSEGYSRLLSDTLKLKMKLKDLM
jgi:hypothetical protein